MLGEGSRHSLGVEADLPVPGPGAELSKGDTFKGQRTAGCPGYRVVEQ